MRVKRKYEKTDTETLEIREKVANNGWEQTKLEQTMEIGQRATTITFNISKSDKFQQLGKQEAKLGNWARAAYYHTQAIREEDIDALTVNHYYNRGFCYLQNEEYHKAIADFTKVLEIDPNNITSRFQRGLAHSKLANSSDALIDFRVASENSRFKEISQIYIAFEKGNFQDVVDLLDFRLIENADHTVDCRGGSVELNSQLNEKRANYSPRILEELLFINAIAYYQLDQQEWALNLLNIAIFKTPLDPSHHQFLGHLHLFRSFVHKAVAAATPTKKREPTEAPCSAALHFLAGVATVEKHEAQAHADLVKVRQSYCTYLPASFLQAHNHIAIYMKNALIPTHPQRDDSIFQLTTLFETQENRGARDASDRYLGMQCDVDNTRTHFRRAQLFNKLELYQNAAKYYQKILDEEDHPERGIAALQLGILYADKKVTDPDCPAKLKAHEMYIIAAKYNAAGKNRLATLYYSGEVHWDGTPSEKPTNRDIEKAFRLYQESIQLDGTVGVYEFNLAQCYYYHGRKVNCDCNGQPGHAEAYRHYQAAENKGYRTACLYRQLGMMLYLGQGTAIDKERSAECMRQAVIIEANDPKTHYYSGLTDSFSNQNQEPTIRDFEHASLETNQLARSCFEDPYISNLKTEVIETPKNYPNSTSPLPFSSVAVNEKGQIVLASECHKKGGIKVRTGRIDDREQIIWNRATHHDFNVQRPTVAINNGGIVVLVAEKGNRIFHRHGQLDRNGNLALGEWVNYKDGIQPSVTINNRGFVVEVHRSENYPDIHATLGFIGERNISWLKEVCLLVGNYSHPTVAIRDRNIVIAAKSEEGFVVYGVGLLQETYHEDEFSGKKKLPNQKTEYARYWNWNFYSIEQPFVTKPKIAFKTDNELLLVTEGEGNDVKNQRITLVVGGNPELIINSDLSVDQQLPLNNENLPGKKLQQVQFATDL